MKASQISVGDRLVFKNDRRDAYGLFEREIVVEAVTYRDGYKTPWIWDGSGRAFSPSDFARKALPWRQERESLGH